MENEGQNMNDMAQNNPMNSPEKSNGAIIGAIIIIVLLIVGGLYVMNTRQKTQGTTMTAEEIASTPDETTQLLILKQTCKIAIWATLTQNSIQ